MVVSHQATIEKRSSPSLLNSSNAAPSRRRGNSAAARRLDCSDVYLLHGHHRTKRALCLIAAGRHRLGQHTRRDLPRNAPLVFAPAARALLAAISDDGVPIAIGLGLIV